MAAIIKNRIIIPMLGLLRQGITPKKLALSVALGFMIGIIPLIGVSTAICMLLAFIFDINIIAIQIVNYVAFPLQIVFYIPFIKAGEKILGSTASSITMSEIIQQFDAGFINAVKILWHANLLGLLVWLMITIPVSLALYWSSYTVFKNFSKRKNAGD